MISTSDIQSLRQELDAAGVFSSRPVRGWLKFTGLLVVAAGLAFVAAMLPGYWGLWLAPLVAVPVITAAMLGHEGAHGSFSDSKGGNSLLFHLSFPLLSGVAAHHWRHKHNVVHHGHPNVAGIDHDIELWPMAMSSVDYAASSRPRRWFQRVAQGVCFWPLTTFLVFVMRVEGIRHLVRHYKKKGFDRALALDAACLLVHPFLWFVVPVTFMGWGWSLGFYAVLWATSGLFLALIFAPAHMGLPLVTTPGNPWLHQLQTTRNLTMPRWLSWFLVGLDHQVEHHLFPRIAHGKLPRAAEITKAWCARLGVPHASLGYGYAIADVTGFMSRCWQVAPTELAEPGSAQ